MHVHVHRNTKSKGKKTNKTEYRTSIQLKEREEEKKAYIYSSSICREVTLNQTHIYYSTYISINFPLACVHNMYLPLLCIEKKREEEEEALVGLMGLNREREGFRVLSVYTLPNIHTGKSTSAPVGI